MCTLVAPRAAHGAFQLHCALSLQDEALGAVTISQGSAAALIVEAIILNGWIEPRIVRCVRIGAHRCLCPALLLVFILTVLIHVNQDRLSFCITSLTVEHLDFFVPHETENEREYLHKHRNVCGEEEDPNIICRHEIIVGIWAEPEIIPALAVV